MSESIFDAIAARQKQFKTGITCPAINRQTPILVAIKLSVVLLFALVSAVAHAHDWYPLDCCHSQDCAPVTSYRYVAGADYDTAGKPIANALPRLVVTTRIGTAIVPDNLPRRPSKDNQMHVCMRPGVYGIGVYVKCIFVPPIN
jgi:hypothetical protein